MIEGELLRSLIPHAGRMCLLDAVEEWGPDRILCSARSHMMLEHPLRRHQRLSALHLVEYAAQAIAVHGALLARQHAEQGVGGAAPRPGMLGALRDIRLSVDRIDTLNDPLAVAATRRMAREDGLIYDFAIEAAGRQLAAGRIIIALRELAH